MAATRATLRQLVESWPVVTARGSRDFGAYVQVRVTPPCSCTPLYHNLSFMRERDRVYAIQLMVLSLHEATCHTRMPSEHIYLIRIGPISGGP